MPYDRDILVAEFLLTSASRGPSAIAELLVFSCALLLAVWSYCLLSVQNLLASSTSRRAAKKKKKKAEKATAEATVEDMDEMSACAEP